MTMKTQLCETEMSLPHFTIGKGGFATSSKFPQGTQLVTMTAKEALGPSESSLRGLIVADE